MRYVSTRGEAPVLDFEGAILAGLARDGGLYLPESWPHLDLGEIAALAGLGYEDAAFRVMLPYIGDTFTADELRSLIALSYASFGHSARCPLVQSGPNDWILELHHGPTLAFKDVAMQLIGQMFDALLTRRGERVTIVGATSGDTGAAAIEAFRGLAAADVFILYPEGRISEVQRRQMTTPTEANVHALAVEGDFDDCQALVKAMFNDHAFRDEVGLAAINSINWARVLAQVVYYVTAAVALGAPARAVSFTVPTGNFGDIFAGHVARHMGLPISRLVIATNENDILHRAFATGTYERKGLKQTISPSMDIQVSSNFERLLFELYGGDGAAVAAAMDGFAAEGRLELPQGAMAKLREGFGSARASEDACREAIRRVQDDTGMVICPHTACGVVAAAANRGDPAVPMVTLGTAHAAKFPDAVQAACGVRPPLPARMSDLYERHERFTVLPGDLAAVESHIRSNRSA